MCSKSASDASAGRRAAGGPRAALAAGSATLTLWYALAGFAIFCVAAAADLPGAGGQSLDRDHDEFLAGKVES